MAHVSVIDTATNTIVATINVGWAIGVAIDPMGKNVYVANAYSNTVSVIDTATNMVTSTVLNVGTGLPFGVAIDPDGKRVYVTNSGSNKLSVIDTASNTVVATVIVGNNPLGVAVDQKGTNIFVTNAGSNTVSIIDTKTNTVSTTVSVGTSPWWVAVAASDNIPPEITAPADVSTEATGTATAVNIGTATATDLVDATPTITSDAPATYPVGVTTVTWTATDDAGNSATTTQTVTINYHFIGFFQPVDNIPTTNTVKAGSAIPVKFSLGGDMSLKIFADGYPLSRVVSCGAATPDAIEETLTVSNSNLKYDAFTGQYIYVWKTDNSWYKYPFGPCRQLEVKFIDGTIRVAQFKFK